LILKSKNTLKFKRLKVKECESFRNYLGVTLIRPKGLQRVGLFASSPRAPNFHWVRCGLSASIPNAVVVNNLKILETESKFSASI
jgi:hypothetical protein